MRFFEEKSALTGCSPRASCYLEQKLEGLESLSFEKVKISSEDMYPAAPEHISGFKKNTDKGSFVMFLGSLLSTVELVEWYVVMGCTVLAYYFGYSVLEYCVYTCGSFSFTVFCHFFDCFVRLNLLVHLDTIEETELEVDD